MSQTREFSTAVIASIVSGTMLCESFSDIHEAAEYLMGHPIWTHHFADEKLVADMRKTVLEQHPGMPTEFPQVSRENWRSVVAELNAKFGKTLTIREGSGPTAMLPTDGIPDHLKDKTIIVGV